jgi:hypothetical protein
MKGDYSRDTFDPLKNFTRVLTQQGRVTLDSDLNEQASILLHYLQTLAADLIGPHGGPAASVGFGIELLPANGTELDDMRISAGRYYVDGILCENQPPPAPPEGGPVSIRETAHEQASHHRTAAQGSAASPRRGMGEHIVQSGQSPDSISFFEQPDYPLQKQTFEFPEDPFLVFLDVWERHVTSLEDPSIQEVALGGPDTSARAKIVWQVKFLTIPEDVKPENITCSDFDRDTLEQLRSLIEPGERALLKARTREPEDINATDPCTLAPDARYRGEENQLYRVEIHRGGAVGEETNGPTFKWSRDNGSNVFPILALASEIVTLGNTGRDDLSSLDVGDWVEIVDDDGALLGQVQPLYQVVSIPDPLTMQVTLSAAPPIVIPNTDKHPLLRRWDQQTETDPKSEALQRGSDGAALVVEGSGATAWLELEDGIQIQFQPGATYRQGDYWLIPARTATGDVEWPRTNDMPDALPPRGVMHHYAPLAAVFLDQGVFKQTDLRRTWGYLAQCTECPTIEVDGPNNVDEGSPLNFKANLDHLPPGFNPAYNWSVSPGIIGGGQGTPSVTVNTTGLGGQTVKATVQIPGLPAGCVDNASHSTQVKPVTVKVPPTVSVTAPASVVEGTLVTYTSTVKNFETTDLKYQWKVSTAGAQVKGNTTSPNLQVESKGLGGQTIFVSLDVEDGKGNKAAATANTDVKRNPTGGQFTETVSETTSETTSETPPASKKRSGGRRSKTEDEDES